MSHSITLTVNRALGSSFGNMIQLLSGGVSANPEGDWIKVEEVSPGIFKIVDNNMTEEEEGNVLCGLWALGLCSWDEEVVDLDAGNSDESQCFGMSDHLRWNDVEITPGELRAPSIDRLKEALGHVAFCAWCPYDI